MKKCLAALLLTSLFNLPVHAEMALGDKTQRFQGNLSDIFIFNHTDKNIAYQFLEPSIFPDSVYQIPMGESDTYNTKFSDEQMVFKIGVCSDMGHFSCNEYDYQGFVRCTPNKRYNGNKVRSIDITSLTTCTVTCLDGTATSCVIEQ
ncbi:MAG: hypothetical protein K2X50_08235 [Gammaproteobacteria bacterium]|nr:hypothetical protein [Gammaproteobacteria bacterium]